MIDLHAHTIHSDGTLTPRELVRLARELGLTAVAVTDHDSIDGHEEALDAGHDLGIEVVPGVEINLEHERVTLDLLGYFLGDPPGSHLQRKLDELRRYRNERNRRMLTQLAGFGYPVEAGELRRIAGGRAIGRPHIGEAMRRRGYVDSIDEAFSRFLRRGAPAWVDRRRLSLREATRLVRRSGGLPVIAHPGIIRADEAGLAHLVRDAARCGVAGIECYYPSHDAETVRRILALAGANGLVVTGGSDFHGDTKPDVSLGRGAGARPIPDEILAELKRRWRAEGLDHPAPGAVPERDTAC